MLETQSYFHFNGNNWVIEICDKHDRSLIIETIELNEGQSVNDAITIAYNAETKLINKLDYILKNFNTAIEFYLNDMDETELLIINHTTGERTSISSDNWIHFESIFNNPTEADMFKNLTGYSNQSLVEPLEYYFTH